MQVLVAADIGDIMAARRDKRNGRWFYRATVRLPDGRRKRIYGVPRKFGLTNTKVGAQEAERRDIARLHDGDSFEKKEVPTLTAWFQGRFWTEWVIAQDNKPSEREAKTAIFRNHLEPHFGSLRLNEISVARINEFKATLLDRLTKKSINNILAVLSKALRYAVDAEVIGRAPKVGVYRVERPEILCWDFDQYRRVLDQAKQEGPFWYAAACLAGEAGLRAGEIRALRWGEDVDLVAMTITVNQQRRQNITGTPKGGRRRVVPCTPALAAALRRLDVVRTRYVIRSDEGLPVQDSAMSSAMYRICRRAGLPERGWHCLRHTFGTHAAQFGVNPWRLQAWLGHRRIDETMRYVHVAEVHRRPVPAAILTAGQECVDPDERILAMLGARGSSLAASEKRPQPLGEKGCDPARLALKN